MISRNYIRNICNTKIKGDIKIYGQGYCAFVILKHNFYCFVSSPTENISPANYGRHRKNFYPIEYFYRLCENKNIFISNITGTNFSNLDRRYYLSDKKYKFSTNSESKKYEPYTIFLLEEKIHDGRDEKLFYDDIKNIVCSFQKDVSTFIHSYDKNEFDNYIIDHIHRSSSSKKFIEEYRAIDGILKRNKNINPNVNRFIYNKISSEAAIKAVESIQNKKESYLNTIFFVFCIVVIILLKSDGGGRGNITRNFSIRRTDTIPAVYRTEPEVVLNTYKAYSEENLLVTLKHQEIELEKSILRRYGRKPPRKPPLVSQEPEMSEQEPEMSEQEPEMSEQESEMSEQEPEMSEQESEL